MKLSHAALLAMLKTQAAAFAKKMSEIDPNLLKGLDDLPNAVAGLTGGMGGKDANSLTQEEKITMDTCFTVTTKDGVKKYCNDLYTEADLASNCEDNFCDTCCNNNVSAEKRLDHMEKCIKVCDKQRAPEVKA